MLGWWFLRFENLLNTELSHLEPRFVDTRRLRSRSKDIHLIR